MTTTKSLLPLLLSEFIGTALLLLIGLSVVIFFWGEGSAMIHFIPNEWLRRAVTGFFFGVTGCLISLSPVGRISGAHINPVVSFAFWLRGKMKTKAMIGYIASQMLGAVTGSVFLLLWGEQGKSISYGNTVPGSGGTIPAFYGELFTTAGLITVLFLFAGRKNLRHYTPYTIPFLYCVMVCLESPLSGCSTNPARSLGPAVISGAYTGFWLYWLAPVSGTLLVVVIFKTLRLHQYYRLETARVSYHNSPTPESIRTSDVMKK
ncbi:MAG: MIP/aquaporin family protein [Chitinophagaceae bacterium]